MAQMNQVMREHAIGMLNAGMSIRAIAAQLNVHHSTIIRFQQTGRTANRPHQRRPRAATLAQDRYIRLVYLRDRFRPAIRTADETLGVYNRWISAQTVRNRLREAALHARYPHHGLDLTDAQRRNRLARANTHFRWPLARWRNVMFPDES